MRVSILVLFILMLTSCGPAVTLDYEPEADFSSYTTYSFYPTLDSGLNALDEKRIMRATDSLLQQKGLIKTQRPDLYVNFYASEQLGSRNTIGIGVGSGGGNVGVGVGGGIPIGGRKIEQQLTIDFIDVSNDALIWQAIGEDDYPEKSTPERKQTFYNKMLAKIFKKYPPKE